MIAYHLPLELITLKLFQTIFFLLLNKKEDIWKNVGHKTVDGPH